METYRNRTTNSSRIPLRVIYEDNHILVIAKPAGISTQSDLSTRISLHELAKEWLGERYSKPGRVYLGLLHRLDRPVAGVVVFAKTSKAASRVSKQFRENIVSKTYLALVEGTLSKQGELVHHLAWNESEKRADRASSGTGKKASLSFTVRTKYPNATLLEINPRTGRKHQIRAQFAFTGHPIVGDRKYGSGRVNVKGKIALIGTELILQHPISQKEMTFIFPDDLICWKKFLK